MVDPKASMIDLRMAAMSGDLKVVRSLLARKDAALEIDAQDLLGDSGLLKAVRYGHLEVTNDRAQRKQHGFRTNGLLCREIVWCVC